MIILFIHIVKPGDSLYSIAKRYGASVQEIIDDNNITDTQKLVPGQAIVIMLNNVTHTVAPGESLYMIAKNYGTTVPAILDENPNITDASKISVGQVIEIPVTGAKLGTIDVNGYATPDISNTTLTKTMPYLTYYSSFSSRANADGSLVPIPDEAQLQAARLGFVAPLLVVTNTKPVGGFDSNVAHAILANDQVQNTLIDNIINMMRNKNYYGLNIDFEYIFPEDKDNYNKFLKKVVDRLHPLGYIVMTALAPKTSGRQIGTLYEAHDYPTHGAIADFVILMTYEWGYLKGPAQAVAPIDQVEKVLKYAVSVIPSRKIFMGMPNYGYDWTLPFVRGSSANPVTNNEAVKLAARVGAKIEYDEKVQAPFFTYYSRDGKKHIVWFDDARSIKARLALIDKYNLAGASYWKINSFFPQNWLVLNSMYDVRKVL